MRKVKYFTYKESEMQVSVLVMNGDKIEKSINYLPQNKGYYNVIAKDQKMVRARTAEEALAAAKDFEAKGITHCYIKVPSNMAEVSLESLRIA